MSVMEKVSCLNDKTKNLVLFRLAKMFTCCFLIISFFIGLIALDIYFSAENLSVDRDFNTMIFGYSIGMIIFFRIFIILTPVIAVTVYLFKFIFPKKSAFPLTFMVAFSCLLGSIFFDKSISPKSLVKCFLRGNYSATIILREEGCKALRVHPFLKITSQGTIENAKVFFKNGKFIYLSIDDKMITLPKELVLTEINKL